MPDKWNHPLPDQEEDNQDEDANLAFTLVARNEAARQMWADPYNSQRYVPASFARASTRDQSLGQTSSAQPGSESDDAQPRLEEKEDTEPMLKFLFNKWPKTPAKGFILGSCRKACDALLGDPGKSISKQMLTFTFNERHELIMNVTSDTPTWVKYNGQKGAKRGRFTWIFPHGQKATRVKVANAFEFDVVLPRYGIYKDKFHRNCESFLSPAVYEGLLPDGFEVNNTAITRQANSSFYLRGKVLGSGSYGEVSKVLRMPDGKIFAAKTFKYPDSFRQETDMLRKVCKEQHKNVIQFVEEWNEGHQPLLIMEYALGGSLAQRKSKRMGFGEIANLANQTLAALVFLHDQKILHRDIKPQNILCVTPNHYKLADFGVSKEIAPSMSKQGTAEYFAPEVYDQTPYSFSADIWSLGVVLLESMHKLPDGHPATMGRRWYTEILRNLLAYFEWCKKSEDDTLEFTRSVAIAMLKMDADERPSARECLEECQRLQADLAHTKDQVARNGADTLKTAGPDISFSAISLDDSESDEVGAETSSTARWNSGGTLEAGREPIHYRSEDDTTVANHGKAGESLLSSISFSPPSVGEGELYEPSSVLPWLPSIGEENLYDPANVIPWPASIGGGTLYNPGRTFSSVPSSAETQTRARSISDTSMKSRHDSDASVEGTGEDGSVTPGRRAPYHPGNEVAAPGRGFFPPSPWVSSPNQVRSGKSEPSRRQRKIAARRSARRP